MRWPAGSPPGHTSTNSRIDKHRSIGVVERWFETLKYEHHWCEEIPNGIDLADRVADFIDEYNTIRPHETLPWQRPLDTYLTDPTLKPKPRNSEQES